MVGRTARNQFDQQTCSALYFDTLRPYVCMFELFLKERVVQQYKTQMGTGTVCCGSGGGGYWVNERA